MTNIRIIKHFFLSVIIGIVGMQVLPPQCLAGERCEQSKRVGASFAKILLKYQAEDSETIHIKIYREIKELADKDDNKYFGIYEWAMANDPDHQFGILELGRQELDRQCFREGFLEAAGGRLSFHRETITAICRMYGRDLPGKIDLTPLYSGAIKALFMRIINNNPTPLGDEIPRVVGLFLNAFVVWQSQPSDVNRLALVNSCKGVVAMQDELNSHYFKREFAKLGVTIPNHVNVFVWLDAVLESQDLYELTLMSSPAQMINEIKRINELLKDWEQILTMAHKQVQAQLIRKIRQSLPTQWSLIRLFSKSKFLNDRYKARKFIFSEISELMSSLDLENKEALLRELTEGRAQIVPQKPKHKHVVLAPSEETLTISKKFIGRISKNKQKGHWQKLLNTLERSLGEVALKVQFSRRGSKNHGFARANIALTLSDGRGFSIQHLGHLRQGTTVPLQSHQLVLEFDFPMSASDKEENLVDRKTWLAPFFAALEVVLANDSKVQQRLIQEDDLASPLEDATGVRFSCEDELLDRASIGEGDGVATPDSSGVAGHSGAANSAKIK